SPTPARASGPDRHAEESDRGRPPPPLRRRGAAPPGAASRAPARVAPRHDQVTEPTNDEAPHEGLAGGQAPAVSPRVRPHPRHRSCMPSLRRPHRRDDVDVPMVRHRVSKASGRDELSRELPALPAWDEARLEVLSLVLRPRLRSAYEARLPGSPIPASLLVSGLLSQAAHGLHALLPVVPPQGATRLEGSRNIGALHLLRLGLSRRLLDLVPMVRPQKGRTVKKDPHAGI